MPSNRHGELHVPSLEKKVRKDLRSETKVESANPVKSRGTDEYVCDEIGICAHPYPNPIHFAK